MQLDARNIKPEELADNVLLPRLRAGDDRAYEVMVYGYVSRLMGVTRRFLRTEGDACEAVQDTFVQVVRALPSFDGRSAFGTWLHRVAVNAALMRVRTLKRRTKHEVSIEKLIDDPAESTGPRAWPDPADESQRQERRRAVARAIDRLPGDYRLVVLMRDVEGLSTAETASSLGVTDGVVKTRLHRARLALRQLLDREFGTELP